MNDKNRNDILLVVGVVILLVGIGALAGNLGIVPTGLLEVWNVGWRATGPLALVTLGVLVVLFATGAVARPTLPDKSARLYRSRSDRWIAGVCGGIADYIRVDPLVVRAVFVLLTLGVGWGWTGVVAYIVLAVVMPEEPAGGVPRA